ncbi:MAG: hypothetical protein CXX71_02360 [Methanobacteriota archaeon]|nr:MAG: hypothetical protein CXX71_02360 [Euryarchaeota archaeon]
MELEQIVALAPEEVAEIIVARRIELREQLPAVIEQRKVEVDYLKPLVEENRLARDRTTSRVRELKQRRNACQVEARGLRSQLAETREKLLGEGKMRNPDPAWAKEKLDERISELDDRLQRQALDLETERKMIGEMRQLLRRHQEWVEQNLAKNPELKDYREGWERHKTLLDEAQECHTEMTDLAAQSEDEHTRFEETRHVLRESMRQLNRARSLMAQSDEAIPYWNHRLKHGFNEIGDNTGDLLAPGAKVAAGGHSSMARQADRARPDAGGEEE